MRVARIELDGIGPFEKASFTIPPPPEGQTGELVLFEGPNGSGKSTIMEAIAVAVGAATSSPLSPEKDRSNFFFGKNDLSTSILARWKRRFRAAHGLAAIEMAHTEERCEVRLLRNASSDWATAPSQGPLHAILESLKRAARAYPTGAKWAAFSYRGRIRSASLAARSAPDIIPRIALKGALSFGEGIEEEVSLGRFLIDLNYQRLIAAEEALRTNDESSRVSALATTHARQESLDRLQAALGMVLDRKISFIFPLGSPDPRVLFDGEVHEPSMLGEGLRAAFSWLSDLLMRLYLVRWEDTQKSPFDQEFWLILDEIDESMHPLMQARLFPQLRKLFPNAHIYATTHSPFAVAACTDGWVFPIRPRAGDRRVTGEVKPESLEPGQSLEYVTEQVFGAPSTFIDEPTRRALDVHLDGVKAIRGNRECDMRAFREARDFLMNLNDEVRTIVAMREGPARNLVAQKLAEVAS